MHFWNGFEKQALNAFKARQLAKQHGLIPEGAWKWGLRNLRKGKTVEQLGQAPKKVIERARELGSKVEAGAHWGKNVPKGKNRFRTGTESGVDLGGEGASLVKNKEFMAQLGAMHSAAPKDAFKEQGRLADLYRKHIQPNNKLNTIHTHPRHVLAKVKELEKDTLIPTLREHGPGLGAEMSEAFKTHPKGHRIVSTIQRENDGILQALTKRHNSSHPGLMPSGYAGRSPYNPKGSDIQRFLMHDVGTHHNIVTPGTGVGIHTVRPDKATGGKRFRSLLFKEKRKK